jgi:hypothetical protein
MLDYLSIKPDASEHAEYYGRYIKLVPEGNILNILGSQIDETLRLVENLNDNQANFNYGDGKWSIKELIGHVSDTERVFTYRGLCFSRNDRTPLPGFEQNDYVENADFNSRSLRDLIDEFRAVRNATLALYKSFPENVWIRRGPASGFEFTVRAVAYIIAGHELHHRYILKERYLDLV